jgi:hypothetical protein
VLDVVAPQVALVTETNVPHEDNVGYFGDGADEAQMVYNFALPPLVLHTFHSGSCERLRTWAAALRRVSDTATFFNFLDSHDGIGLSGARGILTAAEIDALVARASAHGGFVSYRADGEGGQIPYELNVTWYSALNREDAGEAQSLQVDRFLASRAIALALMGVPGVYLPSLFGANNRSINRKTIDETALFAALGDRHSWVHEVAVRFRRMVRRRIATPAFHPNAAQRVLDAGDAVFAVLRGGTAGVPPVLALTNVTAEPREAVFAREHLGTDAVVWLDRITGRERRADHGVLRVALRPYEVAWLTPD